MAERGESKLQVRRAVGALLGIKPATLRNWVEREEIDTGVRPGKAGQDLIPKVTCPYDAPTEKCGVAELRR